MKKIYRVDDIQLAFIKIQPPCIAIHADGTAPTTGWKNAQLIPYIYIQPPADGIWEFDFVAEPPEVGGDALSHVEANYLWRGNIADFKGVKIYASSNNLVKRLDEPKEGRVRELEGVTLSIRKDGPFPMAKADPWPRLKQ